MPDGIIMGKFIGASLTLGAFMARERNYELLKSTSTFIYIRRKCYCLCSRNAAFDYMQSEEFKYIKRNCDILQQEFAKLNKNMVILLVQ